jgi:hypothetical protein
MIWRFSLAKKSNSPYTLNLHMHIARQIMDIFPENRYRIGGIMVSVLASSAIDRGFEPWSGQTKDYTFGICYFSAKHAALRRRREDWLGRNQNNVSE